ncbi:MAG: hypothetical protein LBS21_04350 [Clostridiales bacterium]|jgi:uncharacterized membrane protein|nr:hypothetical protein [Clostridiales bacterium]
MTAFQTNLIISVFFFPVLPILYFILRNESKPKKNIILGVTIPYEARQTEEVLLICKNFRKHLGITALILAVIFPAAFFIKYISVILTFYMLWLEAAIIAPYVSFTLYHRKLKRLKTEKNWEGSSAGKIVLDTKVSAITQKQYSFWLFLPPVIISLIPVFHAAFFESESLYFIAFVVNALLTVLFFVLYKTVFRLKSEVIDGDTAVTAALARIRSRNMGKSFLLISYFTGAYNICFWLFIESVTGILLSSAAYTVVVLFAAIGAEFAARSAQEKLTQNSGTGFFTDEDRYWINGMFYCNPSDRHAFVKDRVGINMSMNLAKVSGKIVMGISVLCILLLPVAGVFLITEEFTPVNLVVTDSFIEASHTSPEYRISLAEIESAKLIYSLPKSQRVYGTGMDTLLKGKFRADGYGECEFCLNPQVSPFIVITAEGKTYILGGANSEDTANAYKMLG